jgi:hypothetical protein
MSSPQTVRYLEFISGRIGCSAFFLLRGICSLDALLMGESDLPRLIVPLRDSCGINQTGKS